MPVPLKSAARITSIIVTMVGVFESPTELDWTIDPMDLLARWPAERRVVMLHSGRPHARWARYTFISQPAGDYRFIRDGAGDRGRSIWAGPDSLVDASALTHQPSADLRKLLASGAGLWLGYLGYELGERFEHAVLNDAPTATGKAAAIDDRAWPLVDLACCPGWLVFDNQLKRWSAHGRWSDASLEHDRDDWWRALPDMPAHGPEAFAAASLLSVFDRAAYEKAVSQVLDYIARGDIFQANLTQRLTATWQGRYPLAQRSAFAKLNAVSPAWYGAYLELAPTDGAHSPGRVIASTSPELFLQLDDTGLVTTRPIKGTRPASQSPDELLHSEKDAAELNMIVDLLRNDLGRVCDYSSVRVTQQRTIETHPTIHHGVATITGRLHASRDVVDLLRAAFPGGSITGAPKIRAMQIIRQLEPVARGPYCGCIGLLSRDTCCLNIAIRTMLIDPIEQRVDFSVGGGIVADSTPAGEYLETIAKARAILQTLGLEPPGEHDQQPPETSLP